MLECTFVLKGFMYEHYKIYGRVAQLDRVLASEAKGRGFESRLAYQNIKKETKGHVMLGFLLFGHNTGLVLFLGTFIFAVAVPSV